MKKTRLFIQYHVHSVSLATTAGTPETKTEKIDKYKNTYIRCKNQNYKPGTERPEHKSRVIKKYSNSDWREMKKGKALKNGETEKV